MDTVCVLFGGVSSEHAVSLRSAASVLRNIDTAQYNVVMVGISKDGKWFRFKGPVDLIESGEWQNREYTVPCIISPDRSHKGLLELSPAGVNILPVDVVFPVLHGKNGEDGTVQGLLSLAGIPYVGCTLLSSAVCMDKDVSHQLLLAADVPKTNLIALTRADTKDFDALEKRLASALSYPMFVKPANAGSSVGVSKAKDPVGLRDALSAAFAHDRKVVVERTMTGREVECAVMGNDAPIASDVLGEIAPKNEFYDYAGKYLDDSTELHIPARLENDEAVQKIRDIAVKAYKALGCRGLARVDFFVDADSNIVLNEINTIPGFTSISMYPKLFEASGISYPELINRLIAYAIER